MGSATYYLKAEYPTGVDVQKICDEAKKFLLEAARLEDAWQASRLGSTSPSQRAAELKAAFPQVWEELHLDDIRIPEDDKGMNFLAGQLCINEELNIEAEGDTIKLSDEVWHFADWDRIANYFMAHGAIKVRWVSDEVLDVDPFDSL